MGDGTPVDVLIVTLCAVERAAAIRRAVDTTLSQDGVRARLTVVVNGRRFDRELFAWLQREPGVRVLYQETPSIFLARRSAREQVTAPFFAFLDDDDYLLPGALRARVEVLAAELSVDAVVTDGYLSDGRSDALILGEIDEIRRDPLLGLIQRNWLATASTLFRTESVPADFFDVTIRSMDMTYLAFRLALEKRVMFIATPTYRKSYSPDSISLSDEWVLPALGTLEKMLSFPMPAPVRRRLRRKCTLTAHEISNVHRRRGEMGPAWRFHLRSLMEPWGLWNYALYTRRLLFVRRGSNKHGAIATARAIDLHSAETGIHSPQAPAPETSWSEESR
jgi:hypothetical protein